MRLNSHAIIIELPKESLRYNEVTTSLQKTLKKTFWASRYLINLPVKGEEAKRRKFLIDTYMLCAKDAKKHDARFLKRVLEHFNKPIKIEPTNDLNPIKCALLKYRVKNSTLEIRFERDETFLFWHLVHKFKTHEITHNFFKKTIYFHIATPRLKREILTLLKTKTLFSYSLAHEYLQKEVGSFFYEEGVCDSLRVHYKTLGVKEGVDLGAIRMRYLNLAKANHPDLAKKEDVDKYTKKFQQIQEAYHAIKLEFKNAS
ncbi:MAG: J domain-containing protein [Sulfurospirillaceae bacterium]|jgi:hypothetical protein|nr:J domain-containing protein [Sulfurospirillaceae bacterium]MCK9545713.1 J domain-containing protein [Sulfurospirillaceae bacterium]